MTALATLTSLPARLRGGPPIMRIAFEVRIRTCRPVYSTALPTTGAHCSPSPMLPAASGPRALAAPFNAAGQAQTGDDQSARVLLLTDIRAIFTERRLDRLSSAELVMALIAIEGRPWAEWKAGKPLTTNGLARLLAPFGIAPGTIRVGDATPKGYQLDQFEDAFARYLPNDEF